MYRGRPPPRGGYPPPFESRGPRPPRPYPGPDYRDDRNRPRPPYHHEHGHSDSYRRSPPRRRYPSPGSGGPRGGEYWSGAPQRETSASPRGTIPLDHNLVITVGNELTSAPGAAPSSHHDRDFPARPENERSRGRSPDRARAKSRGRSKSQPRSQSRSPDRGRDKSRGRSKSRPQNQSRSPEQARAKSRGRSKSRPRSQSRSPDGGRAKSRCRSKSRPVSRSRSRSRGRSFSKAARSKSRQRSHSSSSSCSSRRGDHQYKKGFKELETARRRKELEDMLSLPTKSILKKRHDSGDSPSLQTVDSPRGHDSSNMSHMANQLLQAVRGLEPHMVASVLSELRSDPQMAQRAGLDAEIKEILNLLGAAGPGAKTPARTADDIDDEEKFLYGDSEEPKPPPASEPVRPHGLDLYGDVTDETLYGDYPPTKAPVGQTYSLPPGGEGDAKYTSLPSVKPDQNITVQVSNPAHPSGAEALEEYEKLQDLLKTIGLDLGVVEMTKMAARTKERLHGSNPPKTPTRRRRYSSGSSDAGQGRQRRSHSSSSSSSSRSCGSWSSEDRTRRNPGQNRTLRDTNETKVEMIATVPPPLHNEPLPQIQDPQSLVPHPGVPIPTYPPPQVHGMMPPNFPPPGYGQYGNYLPYMHQQWPPMYPPPSMSLPPQTAPDEFGVKLPPPDAEKINDRRVSEEQNNESQKQKVLEERENLKQERDVRMKKKEFLMKELERLRKQQGELLRKKRREKEGHKDPLLQEISRLQEDVMTQISNLRREHEAAERKRNEIDKVALILGVSSADRPRRAARTAEEPRPEKKKLETSPEGRRTSKQTLAAPSLSRASPDEPPAGAHPEAPPPEPFEYYDAGNHWCKNCNVTSGSMFDFFTHLHSKTHRKTLDPYERPWASAPAKIVKNIPPEEKLTKPAKGSEFLLPVRGFFCLLCRQFYGDAICAEEHVTAHAHNEKYKKQMYENPLYEQRRNLDRQAGLALDTSGKKRKHEDDEKGVKDKEEKPKHKKEKKEKKKEGDDASQEEKPKVKKEEEEEKPKRSKTGEDCKITKSLEEERPSYSKKDEGDNYKFSKKDDKHRYSKEEEERGERYKHREEHRYRYRRDDDDRYADRPKYGPRDTEDKYKFNKYSDSRSKYDRERDGGKPKAEKENYKKPELGKPAGKPELTKPEPPPKPYDPPKIYCGPSPAMRAKLRKQSLEAGKPAPMAPATTFGKFMWKKKENTLTKVAEKIAAEFIKDDEASASQQPASVEDSFAKSMAVAKEIAEKLGGNQQMDPPWASNGANRGRIRPNLPAPAAILRKTTTMGKPAPLNTFLSIRPPTKDFDSDGLTKALTPQNALLEGSTAHRPQASEAKPPLPVSRPAPHEVRPTPPGVKPEPPEVTPPPPGVRPAPPGVRPAPPGVKLAPPGVEPAPPVSAPVSSPSEAKPAVKPLSSGVAPPPSRAKPAQPTMVKIVSDVAAPGVPESEQTRTVFVKPPPFMNMSDRVQKSEKLKSNLATAKAQELLGIFYSGINQSGSSSITKPDSRADKSTTNKSPALQKPKQLPPVQTQTQSQPPTDVQTAPEPDPRADESTTNRSPLPAPQEPKPPPQPPAQTQTQSKPPTQVQTAPEPDPRADENTTNRSPLPAPQEPPPQPPAQTQSHPPTNVQTAPQPDLTSSPPSPQSQPTSDIQIASVWSLNCEPAPTFSLTTQPEPLPSAQCFPQNIPPQTETAEPEPISEDLSHPGTYSDKTPEPEIKPSHKIRGKKTPPAPRPARQTRSQTRYQTRRQQRLSEPEPEPASGDSESAALDLKGLDTSDPGSGSLSEEGAPSEGDPQVMELTPETLGLPSDMTSLDFEYDFNFE